MSMPPNTAWSGARAHKVTDIGMVQLRSPENLVAFDGTAPTASMDWLRLLMTNSLRTSAVCPETVPTELLLVTAPAA